MTSTEMKLSLTKTILSVENEHIKKMRVPKYTLIIDDHWMHIRSHLIVAIFPWAWPVMLFHIIQHLVLWRRQKQMGLFPIYIEEVMAATNKGCQND